MAYAIIRTGGKQFRVTPGAVVRVPLIDAEVGATHNFSEVLVFGNDDGVQLGSPGLADIPVAGTIVEHGRDKKIIVFKMKRRKQYKRKQGHRQDYTAIRIDSVGA